MKESVRLVYEQRVEALEGALVVLADGEIHTRGEIFPTVPGSTSGWTYDVLELLRGLGAAERLGAKGPSRRWRLTASPDVLPTINELISAAGYPVPADVVDTDRDDDQEEAEPEAEELEPDASEHVMNRAQSADELVLENLARLAEFVVGISERVDELLARQGVGLDAKSSEALADAIAGALGEPLAAIGPMREALDADGKATRRTVSALADRVRDDLTVLSENQVKLEQLVQAEGQATRRAIAGAVERMGRVEAAIAELSKKIADNSAAEKKARETGAAGWQKSLTELRKTVEADRKAQAEEARGIVQAINAVFDLFEWTQRSMAAAPRSYTSLAALKPPPPSSPAVPAEAEKADPAP